MRTRGLGLLAVGFQLETVVLMCEQGLVGVEDRRGVPAIVVLEWSDDFVAHEGLGGITRFVKAVHVAVP